jgi:hypothetical protein
MPVHSNKKRAYRILDAYDTQSESVIVRTKSSSKIDIYSNRTRLSNIRQLGVCIPPLYYEINGVGELRPMAIRNEVVLGKAKEPEMYIFERDVYCYFFENPRRPAYAICRDGK